MPYASDTKIIIASRYEATEVYRINPFVCVKGYHKNIESGKNQEKLSLF